MNHSEVIRNLQNTKAITVGDGDNFKKSRILNVIRGGFLGIYKGLLAKN